MLIRSVLIRFFLIYIVLLVVVGEAISFLGIPLSGELLTIVILFGAIFYSCKAFGKKNGRYFNRAEKTKVVWGMIGINFMTQLLIAGIAFGDKWATDLERVLIAVVVGLGFAAALQSIAIYFFVGVVSKTFQNQQAKKVAATNQPDA